METNAKINETSKKEKNVKEQEQQLIKEQLTLQKLKQQDKTVKEQEKTLSEKQKLLEEDLNLLNKELFGQDERKQLTEVVGDLEKLDPTRKEFEATKERTKTLEKMKIEEEYLTNKSKIENKETLDEELDDNEKRATTLVLQETTASDSIQQKKQLYNQEKVVLKTFEDLHLKRKTLTKNIVKRTKILLKQEKTFNDQMKKLRVLKMKLQKKKIISQSSMS